MGHGQNSVFQEDCIAPIWDPHERANGLRIRSFEPRSHAISLLIMPLPPRRCRKSALKGALAMRPAQLCRIRRRFPPLAHRAFGLGSVQVADGINSPRCWTRDALQILQDGPSGTRAPRAHSRPKMLLFLADATEFVAETHEPGFSRI